jgi:hypothetical protein
MVIEWSMSGAVATLHDSGTARTRTAAREQLCWSWTRGRLRARSQRPELSIGPGNIALPVRSGNIRIRQLWRAPTDDLRGPDR